MKQLIMLGLSVCMAFLLACEGEKGQIGPQGLNGAQGLQGEKGDKGPTGVYPKILTGSVTIQPDEWKKNSVDITDDAFYVVIPEKQITKEILENGMIQVYLSSFSISTPLPHSYGSLYRILQLAYLENNEGRIRIDLFPYSYLGKAVKPTSGTTFRWVITPAN